MKQFIPKIIYPERKRVMQRLIKFPPCKQNLLQDEIVGLNILFILGYRRQFRKMSPKAINTFGFPYDYGSVMHYGPRFFSRNGKPTIMVKQAGVGFFIYTYMY